THRAQECGAGRIAVVVAAGLGGDGVILHREGQVGAAHRPALLFQVGKTMMRMQFVEHMPVDVEQIAPVGALPGQMRVPDLVEQSMRHGVALVFRGCALVFRFLRQLIALASRTILGEAIVQGKCGAFRRRPNMPRVVGIDHLVLSVGDFARSKAFYDKLLTFLGFRLKYDYPEMAGWSNAKTLFWIAAADERGRKRKYRKGDIGFHHY